MAARQAASLAPGVAAAAVSALGLDCNPASPQVIAELFNEISNVSFEAFSSPQASNKLARRTSSGHTALHCADARMARAVD
jgi:hypothetical protein